jgi:hypothetical protein
MVSLFAREERDTKRETLSDPLAVLDRYIDFAGIAAAVDAKLRLGSNGRGGRPAYPTVLMVKLLSGCNSSTTSAMMHWRIKCWSGAVFSVFSI